MRAWLDRLDRLEDRATDLTDAHTAAARLVAAAARPPRRTGLLAASQTVDTSSDRATVSWWAAHAPFVHFGTRYMAAQPFAYDAADQAAPQLADLYTDHLDL